MSAVRAPEFIANFDSSTAMVRATARYLRGRDFPLLGLNPLLTIPVTYANLLPEPLRVGLYVLGGRNESIPVRSIDSVDGEELSRWVADEYPARPYPAVAIGSANGAAVHLYCALGIPWLPQTFLVPVRQRVHPDDPGQAMKLGLAPGRRLLQRNPDLQLHHMHDANQDRLMVRAMTYFRVKRRRLGRGYERFLRERLPPGGTVLVAECERSWPVTRVADRHVFQHGAVGGATEQEFLHGGERVSAYLRRYGSPYERWEPPSPDAHAPEAEWGFEPALLEDIRRIARERGYRVLRMRFPEPQAPSPLIADFHRWWYGSRGVASRRLVAESFILLEPYWMLRTGSTPFWMEFNMEPSLREVHRYLDTAEPFDEVAVMLFDHGVESVGLPAIEEWAGLLRRGRRGGRWLGVDPARFPADFAQFARYHTAMRRLPERHPLPRPLALGDFEDFVGRSPGRYRVTLHTEDP